MVRQTLNQDFKVLKLDRSNPYTDVDYDLCKVENIKAFPASALLPAALPLRQSDHNFIQHIWRALKEHGKHFSVEVPRIKPGHSDMILVHESGLKVFVELKTGMASFAPHRRSVLRHAMLHQQRRIFTWTAQWDFLITGLVGESGGHLSRSGYCFNRDELPDEWFTCEDDSLSWDAGESFLNNHYLNFSFNDGAGRARFAKRLEHIILSGPLKAQKRPPIPTDADAILEDVVLPGALEEEIEAADDIDEDEDASDEDELGPSNDWRSKKLTEYRYSEIPRGARSLCRYEAVQIHQLNEICSNRYVVRI